MSYLEGQNQLLDLSRPSREKNHSDWFDAKTVYLEGQNQLLDLSRPSRKKNHSDYYT
jgi:hypothetical protein